MIQSIQPKQQYIPAKSVDIKFKSNKIDFDKEVKKQKLDTFLTTTAIAGFSGLGVGLLTLLLNKKKPQCRLIAKSAGINSFCLMQMILFLAEDAKNEEKAQEAYSKFNLPADEFSSSSLYGAPEAMDFKDEELNKEYYKQAREKLKKDSKEAMLITRAGILGFALSLAVSVIKKDDEFVKKAIGTGGVSAAIATIIYILSNKDISNSKPAES